MKPRTKIEIEADRLRQQLPELSERQKDWAAKNCTCAASAHRYKGRNTDIECFVIATTKQGWQVLRYFYMYANIRRGKIHAAEFEEVMQEWFRGEDYVFFCCGRAPGYCNDAWTGAMSVKRGTMGGYVLDDPREIGYCKHKIERLTEQFKHTPAGKNIGYTFRAVQSCRYAETIMRKCPDLLQWLYYRRPVFPKSDERLAAVRVALRHGYDVTQPNYSDYVDMLIRLGRDIHSPHYLCPDNLQQAHDRLVEEIHRREEAERTARERERARERAEQDKKLQQIYEKMRSKFFGFAIMANGLRIQPLKNVKEFFDEGTAMHHCVYSCEYYNLQRHPNSLILSARTEDGARVETIEVDIRRFVIVQSRGKCNQDTKRHNEIINLVKKHMNEIRRIAA